MGFKIGLGLLALAVASGFARAQDMSQNIIERYEVDNVDVRKAITDLFKSMDFGAHLAVEVQGQVTISLRNASFELVLQNLLKQVNCTYRGNGGIYTIVHKEIPQDDAPRVDLGPAARRALENDGDSVYMLEDGKLTRFRKSDMKIQASKYLERRFPKTTIDLADPKGREALRQVFRIADVDLTVAPEAKGKVTIPEGPASQMNGILALTQSLGKQYYVDGGVYHFTSQISKNVSIDLFGFRSIEDPVVNVTPMTFDKNFIYVVNGHWAYKVRKSDLATVSFSEVR